jgi:lipopolysaccharide/colanic/teichoic acid biosynthesis glycosyltransferase
MMRLLDMFFSALAMLALVPLFLLVSVILYLTGEGEILFVQKRLGRGGKEFGLIKFATMLKDSPNLGTGTVTLKNDSRVLTVGRILRKTKVNELPQLFNIFMGDMSVVGPRPQDQRCFDAFPPVSQQVISKVRPGLSGVGSIVFRNEEELMHDCKNPEVFYDNVIMPYKGKLEEWYVDNNGLVTYFSCILGTLWTLFSPSSAIAWKLFKGLPSPPPGLDCLHK